jgi:hypothetical protein
MRTGQWLIIAVSTAWYVAAVWAGTSPTSTYGYVAMALGAAVAIAIGVGLMALMFRSHRQGYDDAAHKDQTRQN